MKIESSTIQMDGVHAASYSRSEQTSATAFLSAKADAPASEAGQTAGNSSGGLTYYLGSSSSYRTRLIPSRPVSFSEESMNQFYNRLLRHIIEMMRELLEGNNNTRFSDSADFLTYPSQPESLHWETQVWHQETTCISTYEEHENTCFRTDGLVKTSDGREISFGLKVGMSRSFMEETKLTSAEDTEIVVMRDPLVINLDLPAAAVTDQEFFFDIDSDGRKETISTLAEGCGFLALDKNGDGRINDGSELFGTESGDGFSELAAYDEDGNGWIDENDSIFSRLKVWTKDASGAERLIDLKKADVGAIFLGHAATEFSLNDRETNESRAKIQSTGIFLHESTGEAGTIQHVDFAV